ncbi:Uma2 family endonuclease [Candidatus Magnetomonas plexicatena]|uniref:Uma2 family endonuclease n=1 Tax=Candidatus Magnetomonas plexicatena TaxID=2552947 RepID=UPI001100DCF4|nr:Uma2 family endonuclease [Nitrospirales bacterium LBB_01]
MQTIERNFDLTEIINGEEIMGPSPFRRHQNIAANLYDIVRQHIKKHNLGRLYFSPLDVIFEEGINRLQPDILFVKKDNADIEQDWIRGVPDMVCEIISSHSYEMDTEVKKAVYEKYRVPEYWIVMPEPKTIEILTIEGDRYKLYSFAAFEGVVKSKVIDGLQININDIFE